MKRNMKLLYASGTFFITAVLSAALGILIENKSIVSIKLGYLIAVVLLLIGIFLFGFSKVCQQKNELNNEIETLKNKIDEIISIKEQNNINKGERYLLMALTQNVYEPLRIELLKYSAEKHCNTYAAMLLCSAYLSGIEKNGITVVQQDKEKAYSVLKKVNPYDGTGVTDWMIGRFYELAQINSAKQLSPKEQKKKAYEYYKKSSEKGFPKGYNSIGKFYHYGCGGVKKSDTQRTSNYAKASELGDVYATINCGHNEMKAYYLCRYSKDESQQIPKTEPENIKSAYSSLEKAEAYFKKAAAFNNSEAYLNLGIVLEEKSDIIIERKEELLKEAEDCYADSIRLGKSKFSAVALCRLGLLLRENYWLKDETVQDLLNASGIDDLDALCFSQSYEYFYELQETNEFKSYDKYTWYYDNLKKGFVDFKLPNPYPYIDISKKVDKQ